MKKLITNVSHFLYALLVAVLFIGCKKGDRLPRIVESKAYSSDEYGNKLPKGICVFYYKGYENDSFYNSTQEKCDCYKVSDTIK